MDDNFQDVRNSGIPSSDSNVQPSASVGFGQVIPTSVGLPSNGVPPQPLPATPPPAQVTPATPQPAPTAQSLESFAQTPAATPAATPNQPSPAQTPVTPPAAPSSTPKTPRFHLNLDWKKIRLYAIFVILGLLIIGGVIIAANTFFSKKAGQTNVVSRFDTVQIPLNDLINQQGGLSLLGTRNLVINGPLTASNSFTISPSAQPSSANRGQIYYDQSSNLLNYYNGSKFVELPGNDNVVQSFGGFTGQLTLGQGLNGANGQISNSGVLTVQGQTGNVTLVGRNGIAVDGTTLSNTGVTSVGGQTGDITIGNGLGLNGNQLNNTGVISATGGTGITVTDDGAGNITISNTGAGTGTVQSPGGTTGRIAKFTGVQTIADSLLSETGTTVTVNGGLAVTGGLTLGTALTVGNGGTGTTALAANGVVIGQGSGALTAVAAGSAGQCLMSTAGIPVWQACPGGSGGVTSLNGLSGALTLADATAAGSTVTINDASTTQKGIAQFNGTNFSASSGIINTIQNISVAATPTFGALTLTSSQATSPMLLANNTNAGATGNLIDLQLNGASKLALSPAGNMTLSGTVNGQTISSAASFTGTLAVTGAANLNGGAAVTGTLTAGTVSTNTITPVSALTIGATSQSLTLQGNASTTITATNGANTTTVSFQTPTANVNYRLLTAAAGTYDICTTAGNCTGVGGGVTTTGGTTNTIPKFTGAQTIGDSIITDNGSSVTIGGVLSVNTVTPTGALTVGSTGQSLTLQGTTTSLSSTSSGITNTLTFATPSGSNKTITLPNASGTVVVSASGPLAIDAAGNITCATCATGSVVTSLNGLTGALAVANASGAGSTITINDASTAQKGIAQFNSTNFTASSGTINTIQNIDTAATPTFGRLTVTSSQASNGMLLVNNTNAGATGNLLDLQLNGSSKLSVSPTGALTLTGTVNGQTISSAASLTGTLAVAGAASLNGGASVTGTLTANTITPSSALTIGATNQSFLMQGNAASTITATSGANTTTVVFQSPTASVTYRLLTAAAGTYDICTTVGNCAGVGGGVTTSGGTTNTLAKFTGSNSIGDSIITDNGSTVTIGGTLAVNTVTPSAAMTIGATTQNLTLQGATTQLAATSGGITNTLTFATPSSTNKTITIPNATGTVAVSASGPLAIDSAGNITCPTCVTSGGGGGGIGAVDSLDGLTGALTLANSSGSGTTVTIDDASTTQKGIAQFNSTNFTASSGVVNTVQDIHTAATPTFGRLTVTSSQATNAMFLVNNTDAGATGNLIDLQLNGVSKLSVSPAGNMTLVGTVNGQTISSAASLTGTLAVAGAASLNGGATVTGTLTANTITPTSALTVGATNQSFLVQGSSASTITATSGANATTVAFQSPTASVTYRFLTAAAGTYDICTTVGNCVGLGGSVTTAGGTTGKIAKFTGSNAIGDSILTESGSTLTIGGTLAVNTLTPTAALTIGATAQDLTLQGAVVNLKSTASGITNSLVFATPSTSDKTITIPNASGTLVVSASGPLAIDAAGNITCATCATGANVSSLDGLTGALTIANSSGTGSTITINDASTSQKGIAQFNSTNFTASAGTINTVQNIDTAAAPTFGRLTVTSSQATNAMFLVNNTNAGGSGNLIDLQLNGSSKFAVSPAGALTLSSTINGQTISSAASLTGTLAVAGAANLNGGATVTGTLTANTITPTAALTVGATAQSFTLQGNSSSTLTATSGANTTTVAFQAPTASVTYRLLTAAAGTYDICTTAGNCVGIGGSVTTAGGTINKLAKFTNSNAIGDSIITDNGTTVTIGGTLAVNTITPSAALTIGSVSQDITLQGAVTKLTATSGGITNTLTFATPSGSDKTITVPNASGTVAVSASGPLAIDSAGNITCATCTTTTSAVTSLDGLTGALTIANSSGSGSTVTINDASTSQKGIAQFNSTNFTASAGTINTIQDINSAAAPTFGQLTLTSSQATAAMLTVNNTNGAATGNLIDLQLNGASKLAVTPAGAMTVAGTINGQTISSSANFTGTLGVTGAASLNGGASVTGTLTANTITPSGALTVGATGQSFLLQGNASSTITATSGANTTTLAFQSPTANVTYRLLTAAAGTYDICTSAGNCVNAGEVTTAGGTTGKIAKFTGSNTIGDSLLSESGSTVTLAGTLAVNTVTPTAALTIGATTQNLTLQGAATTLSATSGANTNTLAFSTPSGGNKTINVPNEAGTLCIQGSTNCGFAPASGSGNYIQNGTTLQTANFNIQSSAASSIAARIEGAAGQSSQVLLVKAGSTPTANAFEVQNSGGTQIFGVDPQNTRVVVGSGGSCTSGRLCVGQTNSGSGGGISTNLYNLQSVNTSGVTTMINQNIVVNDTSTAIANSLKPIVIDASGTTNTAAIINSIYAKIPSGQSGTFLELQNGSADVLTVTNAGIATLQNTTNSTAAFQILNAAGRNVLKVNTTAAELTLGNITSTAGQGIAGTLVFADGTNNNFGATLNTTTLTGNRTITLPDATGTLCLDTGNCGGSTGYILNQSASNQTADFRISGTGRANTSILTPLLDTPTATVLALGTSTATAINLNQNTVIANNKTLIVNGITLLQPAVNNINAVAIKDTSNNTILNADTINQRIGVGGTATFSKFEVINGDAAVYNSGNNPRLILGDSTAFGQNGFLQWDSANDYFRIESVGTNGLKVNDNYVAIGNIYPDQPLKVANGTTLLAQINTTGSATFRTSTNSTTGFQVQDSASGSLFNIDTLNSQVNVGITAVGTSSTTKLTFGNTSASAPAIWLGESATNTSGITTADSNVLQANGANGIIFSTGASPIEQLAVDTNGSLIIADNLQSQTKGYRLRTNGSGLDFEATGIGSNGELWISGWTGSNYTGTQVDFFRLAAYANLIMIGDGSGSSTPTLLELGLKNTSGDPSGYAGAMYYNTNTDQFRCYENGFWRNCIASARTEYHFINEMIGTVPGENSGFYSANSGAFSGGAIAGTTGHPGVAQLSTGTTTNGMAAVGSQDTGQSYLFGNGDYWRYESVVRIPTLSTAADIFTVRSGMFDGSSTDGTDGCFFKYSNGVNGGKWQGVCINNTVTSVCDTGITVAANTWYRLTLQVNSAGNSVDFGTDGTSRCQVTTNIPTTAGRETSWNATITKGGGTTGTTARTVQVDYIEVLGQLGTPR